MTSGFYGTDKGGTVTKVDAANPRTILQIDGRPAGEVYNEWTDGTLVKDLAYDENGVGTVLAPSSFVPLGEPIGGVGGGEYHRVLHPAFLDQKTGALTSFANTFEVRRGSQRWMGTGVEGAGKAPEMMVAR